MMSVLGIDSGEITGYPEVMPRSKLSATRARSRLLGSGPLHWSLFLAILA